MLAAPVAGGVQQRQVQPPRRRKILQQGVGVAGAEALLALEDVQHVGGQAVAGSGPAADLGHGGEDCDRQGTQPGAGSRRHQRGHGRGVDDDVQVAWTTGPRTQPTGGPAHDDDNGTAPAQLGSKQGRAGTGGSPQPDTSAGSG